MNTAGKDENISTVQKTGAKKMFRLGSVLWYINHCRLFNANPLYTYILNIYDLAWLGLVL